MSLFQKWSLETLLVAIRRDLLDSGMKIKVHSPMQQSNWLTGILPYILEWGHTWWQPQVMKFVLLIYLSSLSEARPQSLGWTNNTSHSCLTRVQTKSYELCLHCVRICKHCDILFQVYYFDFGNIDWVPQTALRAIKPEFMLLPFQAVECHLAGVQMCNEITTDLSKEKEAE